MTYNLAKVQTLHYCQKKIGNTGKCSCIATWQVKLRSGSNEWQYRCDEHKLTSTVNMSVYESNPFDQSYAITKIREFLSTLIGKNIKSCHHTARELKVKYIKNCAVMCFQEHSKKWKLVYYHQIEKILDQHLTNQN